MKKYMLFVLLFCSFFSFAMKKIENDGKMEYLFAVRNGNLSKVKSLIKKKYLGAKFIYVACKNGHLELVKYFVSLGFDIWQKDVSGAISGHRMLFFACEYGRLDIMKYLIELGVRNSIKNKDGEGLIDVACETNHLNIIKYLFNFMGIKEKRSQMSIFFMDCCHLDDLKKMKYLIENLGFNINEKNKYGLRSVDVIRENGAVHIAKYFFEQLGFKKIKMNADLCDSFFNKSEYKNFGKYVNEIENNFDKTKDKLRLVLEAKKTKNKFLGAYIRLILLGRGSLYKRMFSNKKSDAKYKIKLNPNFLDNVFREKFILIDKYYIGNSGQYCKLCRDLFNLGKKDVLIKNIILKILKLEDSDYNDFYDVMINFVYKKRKVIKDFEKVVRGFGGYQINDNLGNVLNSRVNRKVAPDIVISCFSE